MCQKQRNRKQKITEGNEKKKDAAKTLIEIVNTARKSMVNMFYLKINFCGLKK